MKTARNILLAFLLNLSFSIFELVGGFLTGSIAILSDAIHDLGDAASIGVSYLLEKKSLKSADDTYTYGYLRFSMLGALITSSILTVGSVWVILRAIERCLNPSPVHSGGMLILALLGLVVNLMAAFFTSRGDSLGEKAINLHMLEDVLGWAAVLLGALLIKITGATIIDPLLSIAVALFILINAIKSLREVFDIFLLKCPENVDLQELKQRISSLDSVQKVGQIHIWRLDENRNIATVFIVTDNPHENLKTEIKEILNHYNIVYSTIEFGSEEAKCEALYSPSLNHHHHHHHHH